MRQPNRLPHEYFTDGHSPFTAVPILELAERYIMQALDLRMKIGQQWRVADALKISLFRIAIIF